MRRPLMSLILALAAATPALAGQSLESQVATARAAAAEFADWRVAKREGWRSFGGDEPLMGQHWYHPEGPDYVTGDRIDPARPSNLMYSDIAGERRLVALSYNVRIAPGEPMPEGFAGSQDRWHVHDMTAALHAATETRPVLGWLERGWLERDGASDGRTRLAMVHLWLIPNPMGRFAAHNPALAYLDLGLPADWARGVDLDTARGVALATPEGCEEALGGKLWVAAVPGETRRALDNACAQLADYVRKGLEEDRARLNARGKAAWDRLEDELDARLTPAQTARIAAMTEHGHGGH